MKVLVLGLGNFGMFLVRHLIAAGLEVYGSDSNVAKKHELEEFGGVWKPAQLCPDAVILALFPSQMRPELFLELWPSSLLVNISSVQVPCIAALREAIGIGTERILSLHPLFGPVGVANSGWVGKQIVVTLEPPNDWRAVELLETFISKGVRIDRMSSTEHDYKMLTHALAFFLAEFIQAGAEGADPRYLTSSARHMLGLLDYTANSAELRDLILSNPSFKHLFPKLQGVWDGLAKEFGLR